LSDRLVIIPTYNEKVNIHRIVGAVMALDIEFDVLIIDDGSPDGTAEEVKILQQKYPNRLFLVEREKKLGLGTAYIFGFKWGLERSYQFFFEMDADFSHPPEALVRLYHACTIDGADVAVGSRYVRGGAVKNWPMNRRFLSYGASIYVRMITLMPVKDPTAGFVCYQRKVLEALELDRIEFIGYAFQIEMKFKSKLLGFKIKEIPITFTDREKGESKMSTGIIKEAILGVLKLKFDSIFNRRQKKTSLPNSTVVQNQVKE
jgi:dolichol-phosphate mannosyltransferase